MCNCNCYGQAGSGVLYIGCDFGGVRFFNEDGTAMAAAPYPTLHDLKTKKYYVADTIAQQEDGSYIAKWSASVTREMAVGVYNLEVFADSTMELMIRYNRAFANAIVVSPTPGEEIGNPSES